MVQMNIQYQGNLRCQATHRPSGRQLITDAPVDNQGKGESFSPTDLVATALATCITTIMGIYAQRHAIDLTGLKIDIEKSMTSEGPRRIAQLAMTIHMPAGIEDKHRSALEEIVQHCPVHRSINPDIETPVEFVYG